MAEEGSVKCQCQTPLTKEQIDQLGSSKLALATAHAQRSNGGTDPLVCQEKQVNIVNRATGDTEHKTIFTPSHIDDPQCLALLWCRGGHTWGATKCSPDATIASEPPADPQRVYMCGSHYPRSPNSMCPSTSSACWDVN